MQKLELLKIGLQEIINNIDCGNSNLPEDKCDEVLEVISKLTNTKTKLSKYQACKYLNISRATFDNGVREGKIPKGRKEQGFKELFGELEELQNVKTKK